MAVDPPSQVAVATSSTSKRPAERTRWFGWQNLALYAGTDALFGVGVALAATDNIAPSVVFLSLGGIGHIAVGPVVHRFHDYDSWKWIASLTMHILGPIGGVAIGRNVVVCGEDKSAACRARENRSLVIGAVTGTVLAMGLDVGLLTYETKPVRAGRDRPEWTIAPLVVGNEPRDIGLGLWGRF